MTHTIPSHPFHLILSIPIPIPIQTQYLGPPSDFLPPAPGRKDHATEMHERYEGKSGDLDQLRSAVY